MIMSRYQLFLGSYVWSTFEIDIWFNHLTNLKELCLEFKGCHPRQHNYFAFLTTSLEKLSIIGHDIELNSLSYLPKKLTFLELSSISNIYINNTTPFDRFKNLKTLRIENSKIKFEKSKFFYQMSEEFESKQIHFNLNNLDELDLSQMTFCPLWSRPCDYYKLYFDQLPKLKSLRLSLHSLEQINFDLFEKLLNLENLEILFHVGTPRFRKIKSLLSNLKQIKNLKLNEK